MPLSVPLLAVGGNKHILLLKQLAQRAILVHRHEDICATNKLAANVQLRNRLPVAVLFDACFRSARHSLAHPLCVLSGCRTYLI
jgi:hypothetical protein